MSKTFRPPAIPLVTVDPYFSIWSFDDCLTGDFTRHWTGQRNTMTGLVKIDGEWHRFLGKMETDINRYKCEPTPLEQVSVEVRPTTTIYRFSCEKIDVTLSFCTPLLMDDLMLLSRPVSYISYEISSGDGKEHDIELYFDISAEASVNTLDQSVTCGRNHFSVFCGRGDRDILAKCGDDLRIDWGTLHLFGKDCDLLIMDYNSRRHFFNYGTINEIESDKEMCVGTTMPFLCLMKKMKLSAETTVSSFFCVGYDDIHSIEYMGEPLDAYWRKDGATFETICEAAFNDYDAIIEKSKAFDRQLISEAEKISKKYADIISLAYRQTIAAHKLVWTGDKLFFMSKECYSNACIATVDVTYPSIPLFLIYNPKLVCGMLDPIFTYVESGKWPFPYAPHDVGTYPIANGQMYCFDKVNNRLLEETQMPIEECGNMLICTAVVCKKAGSPAYAIEHMEILTQWADYLVEKGFDPENQLCTDDFAGHLAHNCNLSVKAIIGIAAFGMLLNMMGEESRANHYRETAMEMANRWKQEAFEKDHYRLAFDQPDTWSIKYNLVWDILLELNIFDPEIFRTETEYYLTRLLPYGLPLDSRKEYTKSDWQLWAATLGNEGLSEKIIDSMWDMLCHTRYRVPFTDWYEAGNADQVVYDHSPHTFGSKEKAGFQNRTVQGGLFIKLLDSAHNK